MPRIVHLKYSYLPITETFIYQIIMGLNQTEFKPEMVCLKTENITFFPFENLYFPRGFLEKFINFIVQKGSRILSLKHCYPPFYEKMVRKIKPVLLHAHFGMAGVPALFIRKKYRIPLVTTFYGGDLSIQQRDSYWQKAYQRLFEEGDLFLVEGSAMKKKLAEIGCPQDKICLQHIGIDIEKINFKERRLLPEEKIKLLFCGRMIEKKGLAYLLKALSIVKKYRADFEIRVIGIGPLLKKMKDLTMDLGLLNEVKFLGALNYGEYLKELNTSHVLVAPSVTAADGDTEGGAPTVLLEAQAAGLPVIATYHGDIPEVVINGKSGFLVPERNELSLSEKLMAIFKDADKWPEMGKIGRKHIERDHNIKIESRNLAEIYKKLLKDYGSERIF